MSESRRRRATGADASEAVEDETRSHVHEGRMILMAAERYRGVYSSSLEAVQNGIDEGATRIVVVVNLRERQAYIADNGTGADADELDKAMHNIGFSDKDQEDGALGRWGIGFVSPTVACATYMFTTWARSDGLVRRLTFREAEIRDMRRLNIPVESVDNCPTMPAWAAEHFVGDFNVQWRTIVAMHELKADRTTSAFDPQEFRRTVRSRFSRAMRNKGVLVRLIYVGRTGSKKPQVYDIDPTVYTGDSLGEVTYYRKETGNVVFRLWVAPEDKGKHHGEVDVLKTGDNTTVSIQEFSRRALVPGKHLTPRLREAMSALRSGRFAGEITCDKLELHIERSGFVSNDALMTLFQVIVEWYDEHGHIYYEVGREESRESRWREAAGDSEETLARLLRQPRYADLWASVSSVLGGASESTGGAATGKPRRSGDTSTPTDEKANKKAGAPEDTGDEEAEPKSSRRRVGLALLHVPSRSRSFWSFNFDRAELVINTGHDVWGRLDETGGRHEPRNARWIREFQDWLGLQVVVTLARHPNPDVFEQNRGVIDDLVPLYADMIMRRDTARRSADQSDEGDG